MPLFLNTLGEATAGIALCDRCKMKRPLGRLVADGNSPGLRVCVDKPGCRDQLDPWRLPARRTENITLRYPRPEEPLIPEPPINIFQRIKDAADSVAFSDDATGFFVTVISEASDTIVFSDSAVEPPTLSAVAADSIVLTDSVEGNATNSTWSSVYKGFNTEAPGSQAKQAEITIAGADNRVLIGALQLGGNLESYPGSDSFAWGLYLFNGLLYNNGPTGLGAGVTATPGSQISVCISSSGGPGASGTLVWTINGTSYPANTVTLAPGIWYVAWGPGWDLSNPSATLNTGPTFVFPISGYGPWS